MPRHLSVMEHKVVRRREIVARLVSALKPLDYVRAFWEGGAAAFGRVDRWSDLDLYAFVRDGSTKATFGRVEGALRKISPISRTYVVPFSGWEGVDQKFYSLKGASEYAIVDFAIITEKSSERFLTPEIHGKNVFYFDKDDIAVTAAFDSRKFRRGMRERRSRLAERFAMFDVEVRKELNRGNSLEALEEYRRLTLGTLVELLRMKHGPMHYDFRMRYVHYELPPRVVERLERLGFVRDLDDLRTKHGEAKEWISELLAEKGRGKPGAD